MWKSGCEGMSSLMHVSVLKLISYIVMSGWIWLAEGLEMVLLRLKGNRNFGSNSFYAVLIKRLLQKCSHGFGTRVHVAAVSVAESQVLYFV